VADDAVPDESVVGLVTVTEEDRGGDFAAEPALGPEDGSAEVAAEGDAPRPEIERALEPGPCAHLRPLIEHHRTVAHVEDDPRLHLRAHDDDFGGIAEHDAPIRNLIPALGEEVGTVRRQ
jgi:hypothetical protein